MFALESYLYVSAAIATSIKKRLRRRKFTGISFGKYVVRLFCCLAVCHLFCVLFVECGFGQDQTAAKTIISLFEKKGINRSLYPVGQFNPTNVKASEFDPLLIIQEWETVRTDVCEIISKKLNIKLSEIGGLPMLVKLHSPRYDKSGFLDLDYRYSVIIVCNNELAKQVLKKALDLPEQCFVDDFVINTQTVPIRIKEKLHKNLFNARTGKLKFDEIDLKMTQFIKSSKELLRLGFRIRESSIIGSEKLQISTNWKLYKRIDNRERHWRLLYQIKQKNKNVAEVSVKAQFSTKTRLQKMEKLDQNFLGDDENLSKSEFDLVEELDNTMAEQMTLRTVRKMSATKNVNGKLVYIHNVRPVVEVSPTVILLRELIQELLVSLGKNG